MKNSTRTSDLTPSIRRFLSIFLSASLASAAPVDLLRPYRAQPVPPVSLADTGRIETLLRGGNLYLSLSDALALAIENNLDVEIERLGAAFASADLLRASGGGSLRGVPLTVSETPPGLGGPGVPLVTTAATGTAPSPAVPTDITQATSVTGPQTNLSIGLESLSPGAPIPQFDPAVTAATSWGRATLPQTSPFAGGSSLTTRTTIGNVGFLQSFSPGTQLSGLLNSTSLSNNSTFTLYNPYTNSTGGFTVTQPLLRGFGASVNRRFIRIARNNQKVSEQVFRQQLISTVAGVTRLYYDLVSLTEDVRVKQQTLAVAQKLYDDNRAQVETGTMAPIEMVRAQAQVAANQEDLFNSQALLREQELVIKNVLTRRGAASDLIRAARIIPTDVITIPEKDEIRPVQDLVALAIQNRPELNAARLQLANAGVSLEGARNALRPDLNVVATVESNGLAGQFNPVALAPLVGFGVPIPTGPPPNAGGFGSVLSQIFRKTYPTYTLGLQLNLPLRNRVAQADYAHDQLIVKQAELRAQQLENQARLEVEDALIAIERARAIYNAAAQARALQEQSLRIEQQRYGVGLSTTFLLIQYQTYVAQARSAELVAKSDYVKARTALERSTGEILDAHNISIAAAYTRH